MRPSQNQELGAHRGALLAALREIDAVLLGAQTDSRAGALSEAALERILRRHPKAGRGLFSRAELIAGLREFGAEAELRSSARVLRESLRMRPVRTGSGVTPVTLLTKPFPCPGQCVFCPNDVRMPKSYLSLEPGAQRAAQNDFDPYLQTYNRLRAFAAIGHPLDKVELIVLGGTWSHYPEGYQRWFVKRCFDALNDFGAGRDDRAAAGAAAALARANLEQAPSVSSQVAFGYNRLVTRALRAKHGPSMLASGEHADGESLARAQHENESAPIRNVGLSLETRPDCVDQAELVRLRRLGCTKLQLGVQSLSDRVLALNKRGHDVATTRRALRLARAAGFKLQLHVMPNLLGSTPELDIEDYARLFDDPDFRPDELKLYPCSLIESAELMQSYRAGAFVPYTHEELLRVLRFAIASTPRYCRLSRVIRDISSTDIVSGNRFSNFRELAERALERDGVRKNDIRAREIRSRDFAVNACVPRETRYASAVGEERFLEFVTEDDRLLGFVRLSLPVGSAFIAEIAASAMIRELHVYGVALPLGERSEARAQHRGLGRRLVALAAEHARAAGFRDLAVISAVGTRGYYRKLGFCDGELYQHLEL